MYMHSKLLVLAFIGAAAVAAGCSSSPSSSTGTGGSSGGGGNAGNGKSVVLTVTETGWVDGTTNDLGIQGAWYPYGDGYGPNGKAPGDCQNAGHTACSVITAPDPAAMMFAPTGTALCTKGKAAVVPTANDFSTIWGGGIGFDLNNTGGANPVKSPYDAKAKKVIGFSFTLDKVPLGGIRVELPTPTTSTTAHFKTVSIAGAQTLLFPEALQGSWVTGAAKVDLDITKLVSVQFHVPTDMSSPKEYDFCVDKFAAVTE